ncbi:ABC transporter substrate-binding protein [Thauera butanivorans]|uniref:ABC transporter substrate-binding protein n=1 Tax=Thauera butanivorans TaxID=86174 RepID=UPI003AB2DAD9
MLLAVEGTAMWIERFLLAAGAGVLAACAPDIPPAMSAPLAAESRVQPVSIDVCGETVRYDTVPQRAVTHDVNITEMFLYLGLGDRLVGYSGIRGNKNIAPQYREQLAGVPELSRQGMNIEAIVGAGADFVFAGWSYGFREGEVTPAALREFGIQSYILTESCVRKVARTRVSLEDTFNDMLNLGRIFRIEPHAQALVEQQRAELQAVTDALKGIESRPKVFVYDGGTDNFTTSGRFGIPNAMIEAAGGRNIFDDIPSNWPRGNWEDVVERNPEWIVIIDYDHPGPQGKIDFLRSKPELSEVEAIRRGSFVVLTYAEATPGPGNVARVRTLAQAFHPGRVQ